MDNHNSHIPHPESKEQFKENIPVKHSKPENSPGEKLSVKFHLEKQPLHVDKADYNSGFLEYFRMMSQGPDMRRWSGVILMMIIIILILIVTLSLYFAGANFINRITDVIAMQ
ncbi:MAG: hypothetical protein JKY95_17130 [Planctomycetaceae bacterium]|nr:hypothetical protein [Planctomycetaceae bacterium]